MGIDLQQKHFPLNGPAKLYMHSRYAHVSTHGPAHSTVVMEHLEQIFAVAVAMSLPLIGVCSKILVIQRALIHSFQNP